MIIVYLVARSSFFIFQNKNICNRIYVTYYNYSTCPAEKILNNYKKMTPGDGVMGPFSDEHHEHDNCEACSKGKGAAVVVLLEGDLRNLLDGGIDKGSAGDRHDIRQKARE